MRSEPINIQAIAPSTVRVPGRAPRWVIPAVKVAMIIADVLVAVSAFAGAFYLRESQQLWHVGRRWKFQLEFSFRSLRPPLAIRCRYATAAESLLRPLPPARRVLFR